LSLWGFGQATLPNQYYAATVLSMLHSWHAFFFASFDPGGFVTVDKPPMGFWIQAASAKLLGFSAQSVLLPEALAFVGAVAVTYSIARRAFGSATGVMAGLGLAVMPISVVVSRNNTIDSLLVFVVMLAAWATLRASACAGCWRQAPSWESASRSRCFRRTSSCRHCI
jgi:4-amino-4-deoxy-L-arabinose transferase-like glycosyltransferase